MKQPRIADPSGRQNHWFSTIPLRHTNEITTLPAHVILDDDGRLQSKLELCDCRLNKMPRIRENTRAGSKKPYAQRQPPPCGPWHVKLGKYGYHRLQFHCWLPAGAFSGCFKKIRFVNHCEFSWLGAWEMKARSGRQGNAGKWKMLQLWTIFLNFIYCLEILWYGTWV